MKKIKVFGERNTGTNYLSALLALNFKVKICQGTLPKKISRFLWIFKEKVIDLYFRIFRNNLGWKHRELDKYYINSIKKQAIDINFITITKNPYSWLLSLYNRPYHSFNSKDISFHEFLKTRWYTLKRESSVQFYNNPIDMWNKKNGSYISLNKHARALNLTYENILTNPSTELMKIQSHFNFKITDNFPVNFNQSTKDGNKNRSFYINYYGKEKWKEKLSPKDIEVINEYLDPDVIKYFDYKKL